ncbi:uncharacterized protein LOC121877254 isoform X2 [Homarus americanus]|uniref:uncharacterized protein LOC121877254 isoform X2 n=1 Tax=Homarus americanus TaxID=6706 RepID=UPI001C456E03|nr:uncharacterized protein LOC121877254 isoform X2 [Homarus americanus]
MHSVMCTAEVVMMAVIEVMMIMMVARDFSVNAQAPTSLPPIDLVHQVVLDQTGKYVMRWTPRDNDIIIEVQVATTGYVGLGFSPNGGMKGADIVLGWVDESGEVFLNDRYSNGYEPPSVDESQDVELLGGYQNDTHTVLRFSRSWNTCDHGSDYQLSGDTVRVIWAYDDEDPFNMTSMQQHKFDHRGTKSLYLQEPPLIRTNFNEDVKTWDILSSNVSIPSNLKTLYWCKIFKIPSLTRKNQVIGYVPVIEERNLAHVHHILLYECHLPDSGRHYEKWLDIDGRQCYGPNMPVSWTYCSSTFVAWGIGGEGQIYPDNVGLPMGEEHGGSTYILMEVHYDNPELKPDIVDSSGVRIYYTDRLRQYDAGILMAGHSITPMQIIPPNRKWLSIGHCTGSCTQKEFPEGGIRVFEGILHSHLLGSALKLRHIRDNKELPFIAKDMSYDFNYQQSRIFKDEVIILPGDSLITECTYDATRKPKVTFGGFGTEEEMCLSFLGYYPRINLSICTSAPRLENIMNGLGIQDIYTEKLPGKTLESRADVNEQKEMELAQAIRSGNDSSEMKPVLISRFLMGVIVKSPEKYLNTSLYAILNDEMIWKDEQLVAQLQKEIVDGNHNSKCRSRNAVKMRGVTTEIPYPDFTPLEPIVEACGADRRNQSGSTAGSLPLMDFTHRVMLDQSGNYFMLWTPLESNITIEVQVATTGYVGLGFSPNGGMKGADIVMGWVDNSGNVFLHDRYSNGYEPPSVDESQDAELLGGYQNDTHTVLRFSRSWNTCDHGSDYQLSGDTVRVIWAYNNEDPVDKTSMKRHEYDQRGTKSLYLQEPQFILPSFSEDVKMWDLFSPNVSLPGNLDTLYWCKLFKMPPLTSKNNIIGYASVIEEKNLAHVHHIVVYECHIPDSARHFEKWLDLEGNQCFSPNMPVSWKYCRTPIFGWAIGSEGEMFPDHVGFPIGEEHGGATYYMMETHYDNPSQQEGIVDASGIRIFYTDRLRKYDAGTIMFGHSVSPLHIIPPNQKWLSIGHCHSSCTEKELPENGIHLIQGLPHAHLLGSSISLRHIRDGQELPRILTDKTYDFNFQSTRILKEEVTILPGDSLITECGFDATRRSRPTFGGFGTQEEMCLTFLTYYPRVNLSICSSAPPMESILQGVGIQEVYNSEQMHEYFSEILEVDEEKETELAQAMRSGNVTSEMEPIVLAELLHLVTVKAPEKYLNMSLLEILNDEATWQDDKMLAEFQDRVVTGNHTALCYIRQKNGSIANVLMSYPDFTPLEPTVEVCDADQQVPTIPMSSAENPGSATSVSSAGDPGSTTSVSSAGDPGSTTSVSSAGDPGSTTSVSSAGDPGSTTSVSSAGDPGSTTSVSPSENAVANTIPLKPLPCPFIVASCKNRRKPFTQLGNRPHFY